MRQCAPNRADPSQKDLTLYVTPGVLERVRRLTINNLLRFVRGFESLRSLHSSVQQSRTIRQEGERPREARVPHVAGSTRGCFSGN
jgi:hypothetical protein